MPTFRAPRGTRDLLPAERATWARLEASPGPRRPLRLSRDRDAAVRAGRGLRAGHRRGDRRRREGALPARPAERGAASRGPCGRRRLPASSGPTSSTGCRRGRSRSRSRSSARCSATTGRRPAAIASSGSGTSRRSAIRGRRSTPSSSSSGCASTARPGLDDVEVLLNSIGDAACRPAYVEALGGPIPRPRGRAARRSSGPASRRNPLRLLDSKDPAMAELNARGAEHPRPPVRRVRRRTSPRVRAHLDALGVGYRLDPGLVRGLDYYTRTAFEFYRRGAEGQQQALGGGGRYDGLVELLGGRPTPGIGFGLGLDRVMLALGSAAARPTTGRRRAAGGRRRGRSRRRRPQRLRARDRRSARRGWRPGRSSAGASSAGSSRRRPGTGPTSR